MRPQDPSQLPALQDVAGGVDGALTSHMVDRDRSEVASRAVTSSSFESPASSLAR